MRLLRFPCAIRETFQGAASLWSHPDAKPFLAISAWLRSAPSPPSVVILDNSQIDFVMRGYLGEEPVGLPAVVQAAHPAPSQPHHIRSLCGSIIRYCFRGCKTKRMGEPVECWLERLSDYEREAAGLRARADLYTGRPDLPPDESVVCRLCGCYINGVQPDACRKHVQTKCHREREGLQKELAGPQAGIVSWGKLVTTTERSNGQPVQRFLERRRKRPRTVMMNVAAQTDMQSWQHEVETGIDSCIGEYLSRKGTTIMGAHRMVEIKMRSRGWDVQKFTPSW